MRNVRRWLAAAIWGMAGGLAAAAGERAAGERAAADSLTVDGDATVAEWTAKRAGRTDWRRVQVNGPALSAALIDEIAKLEALEEVFIGGGLVREGVVAEDFAKFARCGALKSLTIYADARLLDDRTVAALAEGCPRLETMVFASNAEQKEYRLTNAALASAARLKGLKKLFLSLGPDATDDGLKPLAERCPALEELILRPMENLTDAGMVTLAAMPGLARLEVFGAAKLTDAGLAALAGGRPALVALQLYEGRGFTDAGLASLGRLTGLKALTLQRADRLTDEGVIALRPLARLDYLELSGAKEITDAAFENATAHWPALRVVTLTDAVGVTDRGVAALAAGGTLENLVLKAAAEIGDPGTFALAKSGRLRSLNLPTARNVTDAGLAALARCQSLYFVDLSASRAVTREACDAFRAARPRARLFSAHSPSS